MNFKRFLNEADDLSTVDGIHRYLWARRSRFSQVTFEVLDDLTVNAIGDVSFAGLKISKIPFKFGKVNGRFNVGKTNITSFENAPYSSKGIEADKCTNLTSLKGLSENVSSLNLRGCTSLTSLEGVPKIIWALTLTDCTGLESLHNIHEMISSCRHLYLDGTDFKHSVLGLMLLPENCSIWTGAVITPSDRAIKIVTEARREGLSVFETQEKLMDAGLGEFAEM